MVLCRRWRKRCGGVFIGENGLIKQGVLAIGGRVNEHSILKRGCFFSATGWNFSGGIMCAFAHSPTNKKNHKSEIIPMT